MSHTDYILLIDELRHIARKTKDVNRRNILLESALAMENMMKRLERNGYDVNE